MILLEEATFDDLIGEIDNRFPEGYVFASLSSDASLRAPMNVHYNGHPIVRKGLADFLAEMFEIENDAILMGAFGGEEGTDET